jgi:hypothetical protein
VTIAPAPEPGLITRIKARLETPEKGAAALSGTLHDWLLITWALPAEKVRPHVPAGLALDVLPGPDGSLIAFVQVECLYHESFRWAPLRSGSGQSFHQVTYRVLTRRKGRRGVFDLRTYLSTEEARNARRVLAREADFARFTIHISGDPAREQYEAYQLRAVGDRGQTSVELTLPTTVRGQSTPGGDAALEEDATSDTAPPTTPVARPAPPPFARFADMVTFLTQRDEEYFAAPLLKDGVVLAPLHHESLTPQTADVKAMRASLLTDLGLVTADDLLKPLAVLLQPSLKVTAYPPRLVKL